MVTGRPAAAAKACHAPRLCWAHGLLLLFTIFATACNGQLPAGAQHNAIGGDSSATAMKPTLEFQFTASPKPPIGFGYTFGCKPLAGTQGVPEEFVLTVMVGDTARLSQLQGRAADHAFSGRFELHQENFPNNLATVTGFVDREKKQVWKLVELR